MRWNLLLKLQKLCKNKYFTKTLETVMNTFETESCLKMLFKNEIIII